MAVVIILANGKSTRFGKDKLTEKLSYNFSVLEKTISIFENHQEISEILLVGKKFLYSNYKNQFPKITHIISGGNSRYKSFCRAIEFLKYKNKNTKVIVHNGANPFVNPYEISSVLDSISQNTAVGVGRKITNTVRQWNKEKSKTLPRDTLFAMETPQGALLRDFQKWIYLEEKKRKTVKTSFSLSQVYEITDELMLAEENFGKTKVITASPQNIKITYPYDLKNILYSTLIPIVGFGIDSHIFEKEISDIPCILCGVQILNIPKFSGNSDGDVAFHALCNAILSGLGKNSFSSIADPLCTFGEKNSKVYLKKIIEIMKQNNTRIIHLTLSFEGKEPKVEKYFPAFRRVLSDELNISSTSIGLNATTGENLDGYGKGKGLKVYATVTLLREV